MVLRNYDAVQYYDQLIPLLEASTSPGLSLRRAALRDRFVIKLGRLAQTVAVRRDVAEMREIRNALRESPRLRAFHEGREHDLPDLYRHHLARRLGRFAELLSRDDLVPVPAQGEPPIAGAAGMVGDAQG